MRCWRATSGYSWWAGELRKAGLEGGMDELRARAFLDLVLGKDSRPRAPEAAGAAGQDAGDSAGGAALQPPGAGPAGGPADGFAGRVTLTVPLATRPAWTSGPASCPGWARSTRGWPATWPPPPRRTRGRRGA